MLDKNTTLLSINTAVKNEKESQQKVLLLRGCKIYAFSKDRIYSELEEQTFDTLNSNEGYGVLEIEFSFDHSIISKNYPQFYTKCFVIRTDTDVRIKPMKTSNRSNNSKVNQNGDLSLGVSYYFRNASEVEKVKKCNSILVEGFIALDKPTNVFGVMCQLEKTEGGWEIASAYTYKPKYAKNIKSLMD